MKKWKWMAIVGMAGILAGCGPQKEATDAPAEQETVRAEEPETAENGGSTEKTPETENAGHAEMSLEDAAGLLGMKDSETAEPFGGGEENWTEDHSFYLGRIFQAELYGEACSVHTTCSKEGIVDSVSIWAVNGERQVTDEEVKQWTEQITEQTEAEPSTDPGPSEGGSVQTRWKKDGKIVTMDHMKDILTIRIQELKGEMAVSETEDNFSVEASRAGFILAGEGSDPNIVFGLRDGKLAVSGINY